MRGRPERVSRRTSLSSSKHAHNLIQTLRRTETSWTGTDNEHVDRTGRGQHRSWRGSPGKAVKGWRGSHFFLGGSHGALQQLLKARNSFQGLAGVVEHVLGGRAWQWRGEGWWEVEAAAGSSEAAGGRGGKYAPARKRVHASSPARSDKQQAPGSSRRRDPCTPPVASLAKIGAPHIAPDWTLFNPNATSVRRLIGVRPSGLSCWSGPCSAPLTAAVAAGGWVPPPFDTERVLRGRMQ